MEQQWFLRFQGKVLGPFSVEELHTRAKRGRFTRLYEVSTDGSAWTKASAHPELFPPVAPPPRTAAPPDPQATAATRPQEPDSSTYAVAEVAPAAFPNLPDPVLDALAQPAASLDRVWYYTRGAEECGPVSISELRTMYSAGQIGPDTFVFVDGMADWVLASQVPSLFAQKPVRSGGIGDGGGISPLAIASLVCGIAGATVLPLIGSILAVVFGHVALGQVKLGRLEGRGMAIAGLVLGYVMLTISMFVFLLFLVAIALSG